MFELVGGVTNEPSAPVNKETEPIQLIVIAAEPTLQLNQGIIGPVNEEGAAERIQPFYIFCLIHCYHSVRKIILICTGQTVLCG